MKKRFGTLALALVMACSLAIPAGAAQSAATDVQGHWAQTPLERMVEKGVMTGTSAGVLSPDQGASRAMAVTVLYRYQGSPKVEAAAVFSDVPKDAYYYDAVSWAVHEGIVQGKTAAAFAPNDPVTRQEFVTMLYRWHTQEKGIPTEVGKDSVYTLADFADAQAIHAYAVDAMNWAVGDLFLLGVTKGEDRLLNPEAPITRGEMSKILYQYDCAVLGTPGQCFAYAPEQVEKILVRKGTGPRFWITDPDEIARFLQTVNGFTYTKQRTDLSSGGWYYIFEVYSKGDDGEPQRVTLMPNGVRVTVDPKGELFYVNEAQENYFAEEWLESFHAGV